MSEMHYYCLNNKSCSKFLKYLYGLFLFLVSEIFLMSFLNIYIFRCHEANICEREFLEPKES